MCVVEWIQAPVFLEKIIKHSQVVVVLENNTSKRLKTVIHKIQFDSTWGRKISYFQQIITLKMYDQRNMKKLINHWEES